jgi:hypothetical protein
MILIDSCSMLNSDFWKRSQSFLEFLQSLLIAHWRTLLLVLLGVGFPLVVFEQLAAVIWRNEGGLVWDKSLLLAIHTTVTPQLDRVAVSLTKLGSYKGIFPVATVIALLLLYWRRSQTTDSQSQLVIPLQKIDSETSKPPANVICLSFAA